jgi:general secretion pathway protein A
MALYEAFYGLARAPFSSNPDPSFLFPSPHHREALAGLCYTVSDGKGFAVLTGEVGTGKTTIVHALFDQLGAATRSALVFNPNISRQDLYFHLLAEFRLPLEPSVAGCVRSLQRFLIEQFEAEIPVVLVIDEAHALSDALLEEVRLLSNFETSRRKLLQILLVGQPELLERLGRPELRQLRQRIALRFDLPPLCFAETVAYVRMRLAAAGARSPLFERGALAALQRYSGGFPRLINILCDNALLTGFNREHLMIGRQLIELAARDLALDPIARVGLWERLKLRYRRAPEPASESVSIFPTAREQLRTEPAE